MRLRLFVILLLTLLSSKIEARAQSNQMKDSTIGISEVPLISRTHLTESDVFEGLENLPVEERYFSDERTRSRYCKNYCQ